MTEQPGHYLWRDDLGASHPDFPHGAVVHHITDRLVADAAISALRVAMYLAWPSLTPQQREDCTAVVRHYDMHWPLTEEGLQRYAKHRDRLERVASGLTTGQPI